MIFRPRPFNKLLKREVQNFESRTEVNHNDVIINLRNFLLNSCLSIQTRLDTKKNTIK